LGQLTTYHTKLLEYNLVKNGVEGVYNIYLQHHSLKDENPRLFEYHYFTPSLITTLNQ
jgi:hypothetical protein